MQPVHSHVDFHLIHNSRAERKTRIRLRRPDHGPEAVKVVCPACRKNVTIRVLDAGETQRRQQLYRGLAWMFAAVTVPFAVMTVYGIATDSEGAGNGGFLLTVLSAVIAGNLVYRVRNTGVSAAGLGSHYTQVIHPRRDRPRPWTRIRTWVRAGRGGQEG
ncbi:hypothetical protein [Streptomyces sp. NBC_00459]|uniref:hypothetical protein n=1 Tax=Streptomyces sp. NBC_00459 TaxID=2975749 RepID=UPI002E19ED0D